jgi:cell division inhibitor SulA
MFDLTDVKYVKRVMVGSHNPNQMLSEDSIHDAEALLNRCLCDTPKGTIIAIERSFNVLRIGEHQVVLQWIVYHVGFPRKPVWMPD